MFLNPKPIISLSFSLFTSDGEVRHSTPMAASSSSSKKKRGPSTKELEGMIFAGADRIPVETKLVVKEKVFELEKLGEAKRIFRDGRDGSPPAPEARPVGPECAECKGNDRRKCKSCG